jgi:outer membrane protein assembly factor BamB/ABC-type phosphate/phosphonate transport system substrate-binding protein
MKLALRILRLGAVVLLCTVFAAPLFAQKSGVQSYPLTLIVMDPLARELACACVKGYGQRDYRKLSALLATTLKQRVNTEFSDDLADTLEQIGGADGEFLVIGDRSVVLHHANRAELKCIELCQLSDRVGKTDLAASIVVRSDDPARELKDIAGRRLVVGFHESDAKFGAVMEMLKGAGIEAKPYKHLEYNIAALDLLDSEASPLPIAILPSYGLALLEGCGSVRPRSLRVIAQSPAVPFITLFASDNIVSDKRARILTALLDLKNDPLLLEALESKDGFKLLLNDGSKRTAGSWPDWRGPGRAGRVPHLPAKLPSTPKIVWKKGAVIGGLAGLSISDDRLLVAERDLADEKDVYRCFNATDGELIWRVSFHARGNLDYGNAQRAAPVIHNGRAYVLGAFGNLRCLEMSDGKLVWERSLISEFSAVLPTWGTCSPPLIIDNLLIVNPGSTNASLAALDLTTGHTRWTTPGAPSSYCAFISGSFGGRPQIVGYDEHTLGGWDPQTGKRLWQLIPPIRGDFNVPTPNAVDGGILVATENNGTRFYQFSDSGEIIPRPTAHCPDLAPDTSTPVVTNGRVFGANHESLYCLDLKTLRPIWHREEANLGDHASLVADDERVLITTLRGELILLDARANESPILSRMKLFEDNFEVYAHPALVGSRLYTRAGDSVMCVDLSSN